jgi:hypothetical protein
MERVTTKYKRGDVVQITPDEESNGNVRGCIGVVTGGAQKAPDGSEYPVVIIVAPHGEQHSVCFRDADVDYIGTAVYMPETEWMPVRASG